MSIITNKPAFIDSKDYTSRKWSCLLTLAMNEKPIIVVNYAIVKLGSSIVLTHEKDRPGWKFPGGWLQWGETMEKSVKRECLEEIGVDVEVDGFIGTWQHLGDNDHRIFSVTTAKVSPDVTLRPDGAEVESIDLVEISDPRLRDPSYFFKRRYFEAVGAFLDGKILPKSYIERITHSHE
jgi:8-oxo-dGTP diphosphatase